MHDQPNYLKKYLPAPSMTEEGEEEELWGGSGGLKHPHCPYGGFIA